MPGHAEEALKGLMTEVQGVQKHGFSASEFERAKKNHLRFIQRAAKEIEKTDSPELASEITRNYFTNEQMPGREFEADLTAKLLPTITLADVNALAKPRPGGRVILLSGPASDKLPSPHAVDR